MFCSLLSLSISVDFRCCCCCWCCCCYCEECGCIWNQDVFFFLFFLLPCFCTRTVSNWEPSSDHENARVRWKMSEKHTKRLRASIPMQCNQIVWLSSQIWNIYVCYVMLCSYSWVCFLPARSCVGLVMCCCCCCCCCWCDVADVADVVYCQKQFL